MTDLIIQTFIQIRPIDIIDILLVAYLLYELYNLIKGTVAINIFLGIIAIYLVWKLVELFEMELLSEILGQFISVGVIALIVVFQQEIRKFLLHLGTPNFISKGPRRFMFWKVGKVKDNTDLVSKIVTTCRDLSASMTGGLIILTRKNELQEVIDTGDFINSEVSEALIETIFFKNTPLHDGAVVISGNRIKAARCVLPLTRKLDFPPEYGLRHRAALGITESTDAVAIVISEQTGKISHCVDGELTIGVTPKLLSEFLKSKLTE
jgi:diadenylate cyclase